MPLFAHGFGSQGSGIMIQAIDLYLSIILTKPSIISFVNFIKNKKTKHYLLPL